MTQNEFWKEIETRTSKDVADYGMEAVSENDLPGTSFDSETNTVTCSDLDEAASAVRKAHEDFHTVA